MRQARILKGGQRGDCYRGCSSTEYLGVYVADYRGDIRSLDYGPCKLGTHAEGTNDLVGATFANYLVHVTKFGNIFRRNA